MRNSRNRSSESGSESDPRIPLFSFRTLPQSHSAEKNASDAALSLNEGTSLRAAGSSSLRASPRRTNGAILSQYPRDSLIREREVWSR